MIGRRFNISTSVYFAFVGFTIGMPAIPLFFVRHGDVIDDRSFYWAPPLFCLLGYIFGRTIEKRAPAKFRQVRPAITLPTFGVFLELFVFYMIVFMGAIDFKPIFKFWKAIGYDPFTPGHHLPHGSIFLFFLIVGIWLDRRQTKFRSRASRP